MIEKHNLMEKLSELQLRKNDLVKSMSNSEMKNGVDAIINVIVNSIKKK